MAGRLLIVDVGKCTGCDSCILACSFRRTKAFSLKAAIQVEKLKDEGVFVPVVCRHCAANAPCAAMCPVDALVKDQDTGEMKLLTESCIACCECITSCPFGAITYDDAAERIVKCDLCGGDPQCVKACTTGALCYMKSDALAEARRAEVAGRALAVQQVVREG